jgi:hypothetical protein
MIRRADEPTEAAESDMLASAGETRAYKGTLDGSLISLQRRTLSSQVHQFLSSNKFPANAKISEPLAVAWMTQTAYTFDYDWFDWLVDVTDLCSSRVEMFIKLRRLAASPELRQNITWQDVAVLMYGEVLEFTYPEAGAPTELGAALKYWQSCAPRVNEAARVYDTATTLDPSFLQIKSGTEIQEQHLGLAGALHHQGELERYNGAQASQTPVSAAAAEMDRVRKRPRLEENPGTRCSFCKGKHRHRHDKRNCPGRRMLPGQQLLLFPPKRSSSSSSISHHHLVGDQQPETSNQQLASNDAAPAAPAEPEPPAEPAEAAEDRSRDGDEDFEEEEPEDIDERLDHLGRELRAQRAEVERLADRDETS